MLQIPKVPTIRKGFSFGDVGRHELRQQLATEIRETIEALIASTYVPGWQGMFYKFRNCIEPGAQRDDARIPYPVTGPNDRHGTQIGCVYARLGWVVKLFWDFCFGVEINVGELRGYIHSLHEFATAGIDKCEVLGNPREGYWLGVTK